MARIRSAAAAHWSLRSFGGLYEVEEGELQRNTGFASVMDNLTVTGSGALRTRPGTRQLARIASTSVRGLLAGVWEGWRWLLSVEGSAVWCYDQDDFTRQAVLCNGAALQLTTTAPVLLFAFQGKVYLGNAAEYYRLSPERTLAGCRFTATCVDGYVPVTVTGASPSGGGTALEGINLLSNRRRVRYSADGTSTDYVLPETPYAILRAEVNGTALTPGTDFSLTQGKCRFTTAPPAGTNNVELTYQYGSSEAFVSRPVLNNTGYELFNGPTDSRVFLYGAGDGHAEHRHICYYSGITEAGEPSAEYFPALNQLAVGDSGTRITGMARQSGKLLAFKPDGMWSIGYEPLTLPDGSVTAGFCVRPQHRTLGSDVPGQTPTVANCPRTFCRGTLYDWTAAAQSDSAERYAKPVSEPVRRTLAAADRDRLFLFYDDLHRRFFCFLNDDADGAVLVRDETQGLWYRWTGFYAVHHAVRLDDGRLIFSYEGSDGAYPSGLRELSDSLSFDYALDDLQPVFVRCAIPVRWESGYLDLGAPGVRKSCAFVWATLRGAPGAIAALTARTDHRAIYETRTAQADTTGLFDATEFDRFSFETHRAPRTLRLRLKLRRFTACKLILTAGDRPTPLELAAGTPPPAGDHGEGAVTVLGFDMKLRPGADAR